MDLFLGGSLSCIAALRHMLLLALVMEFVSDGSVVYILSQVELN